MCLLKVYLEEEDERRLIAEDVALIVKEGGDLKLLGLEFTVKDVLEEVDVSLVDTLNSVMVFKSTQGSRDRS